MYTFGIVTASQQFCQETQQNIAVTYNRRNNLQRWGGEMLTYCGMTMIRMTTEIITDKTLLN
jgi:hypothetical protein